MSTDLSTASDASSILSTYRPGDPGTLDRLVPLVYAELEAMARRHRAREQPGHTLETAELVHEAFLKLVDHAQVTRRGRAYFFAAASRAMRQVLVDHARRRGAAKRGGGQRDVSLDQEAVPVDGFAEELLDVDSALEQLAILSSRQARVVECRYFGGLSVEETAEALDVSPRTVKSDWALARAWLYTRLRCPAEQ